jgi:hypothetical protein
VLGVGCKVRGTECGMRSTGCGVRGAEFTVLDRDLGLRV